MARMVNCVKLGREAEGLDLPPIPGELGKRVFENVSEGGLAAVGSSPDDADQREPPEPDGRPGAAKYLAEQMERFFFGGGADQIAATFRQNLSVLRLVSKAPVCGPSCVLGAAFIWLSAPRMGVYLPLDGCTARPAVRPPPRKLGGMRASRSTCISRATSSGDSVHEHARLLAREMISAAIRPRPLATTVGPTGRRCRRGRPPRRGASPGIQGGSWGCLQFGDEPGEGHVGGGQGVGQAGSRRRASVLAVVAVGDQAHRHARRGEVQAGLDAAQAGRG